MQTDESLLYSGTHMVTEQMGGRAYEREKQLGDIHWISYQSSWCVPAALLLHLLACVQRTLVTAETGL